MKPCMPIDCGLRALFKEQLLPALIIEVELLQELQSLICDSCWSKPTIYGAHATGQPQKDSSHGLSGECRPGVSQTAGTRILQPT